MKTVTFGLYNQISNRSPEYQDHIKFITEFSFNQQIGMYAGRRRQKTVAVESTNIDDIIAQADIAGTDYAYIVAYGHRCVNMTIIDEMIAYAEENNYGLVGHILQDNPSNPTQGFYSLHHQTVLIDMAQWRAVGKPQWGTYTKTITVELPLVERSIENFHDDYTPFWIRPAGGVVGYTGTLREGWSLIAGFVKNGLSVGNFPQSIRNSKQHIYPDSGVELEQYLTGRVTRMSAVPEPNQRFYLGHTNFTPTQNNVFVFNTDTMINDAMTFNKNIRLDNIYCVAAGFKPIQLLNQCEWHRYTRMVYFDYSDSALNFKKWLLENWDGRDYIGAIEHYKTSVDTEFRPIWFLNRDMRPEWDRTVEVFGGEEAWLDLWRRYKEIPHKFIKTNLFGDYTELIADMEAQKRSNSLIWFSNSFNTEAAVRNFTRRQLQDLYLKFLEDVKDSSFSVQVCGTDQLGKANWFHKGSFQQ